MGLNRQIKTRKVGLFWVPTRLSNIKRSQNSDGLKFICMFDSLNSTPRLNWFQCWCAKDMFQKNPNDREKSTYALDKVNERFHLQGKQSIHRKTHTSHKERIPQRLKWYPVPSYLSYLSFFNHPVYTSIWDQFTEHLASEQEFLMIKDLHRYKVNLHFDSLSVWISVLLIRKHS